MSISSLRTDYARMYNFCTSCTILLFNVILFVSMINADQARKMTAAKEPIYKKELKYIEDTIVSNANDGLTTARVQVKAEYRTILLDKLQKEGFQTEITQGDFLVIRW